MRFIFEWLGYFLLFVAGSAVAWAITIRMLKPLLPLLAAGGIVLIGGRVNFWLAGLAFVLGLVLTFSLEFRRAGGAEPTDEPAQEPATGAETPE